MFIKNKNLIPFCNLFINYKIALYTNFSTHFSQLADNLMPKLSVLKIMD